MKATKLLGIVFFLLLFSSAAVAVEWNFGFNKYDTRYYVQSIVAVIIIMMIPCFAHVGAIVKEIGVKKALTMVFSIYIGSIIIAGGLNWILVFIIKP